MPCWESAEDEREDDVLAGVEIPEAQPGIHRHDLWWDVGSRHHMRSRQLFVESLEMLSVARAPYARALEQLPEPFQVEVGHRDVATVHGSPAQSMWWLT